MRPIAEIMFSDFFAVCWDMVANQIAKSRYMTDGQVSLPLVIRTANGGWAAVRRPALAERRELGDGDPGPEGRRAVDAGRRRRADGRRRARPDPVVFFEHKGLFATKGEVPDGEHRGHARPGRRFAGRRRLHDRRLGAMVPRALEAAERLGRRGASAPR